MPIQFTLRDLFLATTLIAFGVGGMVLSLRHGETLGMTLWYCSHFASGAVIGAGLLTPLDKKTWGAVIGVALTWLLTAAVSMFLVPHH